MVVLIINVIVQFLQSFLCRNIWDLEAEKFVPFSCLYSAQLRTACNVVSITLLMLFGCLLFFFSSLFRCELYHCYICSICLVWPGQLTPVAKKTTEQPIYCGKFVISRYWSLYLILWKPEVERNRQKKNYYFLFESC